MDFCVHLAIAASRQQKKEPQKGSGVLQVRILLNEISDGNGIAKTSNTQKQIESSSKFHALMIAIHNPIATPQNLK